ncbi:cytochrome d ubiquinol oxidase subunit II [Halorubrum distributum]|uniref:Cytochrome d ubiquinol oxidase subunit II n=1 Tax=Halorubrum distributum JCM 10247 TaxID=1227486 RepID=M0DQG1_9EURY|nr:MULTISPECIES: cytochrome d ubiquinol oxidase subunit II [Halorubrum distributum group]ELZ36927.1 cytochrome d ubiquinol oxidase subunit II [Halorubrum terrestre JCM 10247]MDV7351156.1 cytochrome d ubiquinol oxidase subunit II [Halorubrum distributum]
MTELVLLVDAYLVDALPEIWFGAVMFALAMYIILDGFDFGIGMLYATRNNEHEKETFLTAFGPVWDANEVWVVAFGTMLLAAFPPVYSRVLADHYLLAIGFVLALLFRGLGPEMREQRDDERWKRYWDFSFIGGSFLAPLLFGTLAGRWIFDAPTLSLPALLTGVGLVTVSVATGAAFLTAKTRPRLASDLRTYGIIATLAYLIGVIALLTTVVVTDAGGAAETVLSLPVGAIVVLSVVAGGGGSVLALRGEYRAWLVSALGLPALLSLLVALLLYPNIYPPTGLTVREAVVSPLALNLVTILGFPALLLVLWYFKFLYGVFSGPIEGEGYKN